MLPVVMGAVGLPALMASNYLRDPSSKMPDDPFWNKALTWFGKSFQVLFEILTLNNIVLAAFLATPSRFITYGLLAIANAYFGQFEWKQIDLCNAIREKNKEIQDVRDNIAHLKTTQSSEKKQLETTLKQLIEEKRELYDNLDDAEAQSNFFARVLMNIIMAFSFGYFNTHTSTSTKFGNLDHIDPEIDSAEKIGPYKARHTNGFTWEHFWNGYPNGKTPAQKAPPWPKLMLENGKKEWDTFWAGCKNVVDGFIDPKKNTQGTLWGQNKVVEKRLKEVGDTFFNRWRVRLSGGLMPMALNNLNIIARFAIAGLAGGAISLLGMSAYNKERPYDPDLEVPQNNDNDETSSEEDKSITTGEALLDGSKSLIWWGRMLSGVSGLLLTFNPPFLKVSGVPSMAVNGTASALSIVSALAGGIPGLATVDIFAQFLSTISFNAASGLSSLNRQLSKDHIKKLIDRELNRGLETERMRLV